MILLVQIILPFILIFYLYSIEKRLFEIRNILQEKKEGTKGGENTKD